MPYDAGAVSDAYDQVAEEEDRAEKSPSLRTELPRAFIKKYLQADDVVLDAGGGTGINAIMMAARCRRVTLLDISPKILELAQANVRGANLEQRIKLLRGDITALDQLEDASFSFVVCVGDAVSYALDKGRQAVSELVRVAEPGAILVISCDSRYGFLRLRLSQNLLDEAVELLDANETYCGMGPRTRLYTVGEMTAVLQDAGCDVLEVAATPALSHTIDRSLYRDKASWQRLLALELEICTRPDLLGIGDHLLFVARKGPQ